MIKRIVMISLMLILASGCASKQYDLGADPQTVSACGQPVEVAIEGSADVEVTADDCRKMERTAKEGNSGNDLMLQILGYAAGFAIGMALF